MEIPEAWRFVLVPLYLYGLLGVYRRISGQEAAFYRRLGATLPKVLARPATVVLVLADMAGGFLVVLVLFGGLAGLVLGTLC